MNTSFKTYYFDLLLKSKPIGISLKYLCNTRMYGKVYVKYSLHSGCNNFYIFASVLIKQSVPLNVNG